MGWRPHRRRRELLEEVAEDALGDREEAAVDLAHLDHRWNRKVARRELHRQQVDVEGVPVRVEPDHQIPTVVPEGIHLGPRSLWLVGAHLDLTAKVADQEEPSRG